MNAETELGFLRDLQRLLVEGDFVATYKCALLQALADLCVERPFEFDGAVEIRTTDIAEKFVAYYWRQAAPFVGSDGGARSVLRQNPGKQAAVINRVEECRSRYNGSYEAARRDHKAWERLLVQVRRVVEQMPLLRLQVVGREAREFLYAHDSFSQHRIVLRPGVAAFFRAYHGLITHLVRGAWVSKIRRLGPNRELIGAHGDLEAFLFGSERVSLEPYQRVLREHQGDRCFYCRRDLKSRGEVDHFIAWSRYPLDLGHNFVLAHGACNAAKRDLLAHPEYLARWRADHLEAGAVLTQGFEAWGLPHDVGRSRAITVWAYEQGEASGALVWTSGKQLEPLTPAWRDVIR